MKVKKAFNDMFDTLYNEGRHYDYSMAFERLLQFIIADHLPGMILQSKDKMEWLLNNQGPQQLKLIGG